MIAKFLDRREVYLIVSIVLAILFWFYVREVEDPEQSKSISDVAISIASEHVLENQGLTIADLSHESVDLDIHSNISVLGQLSNKNITATLDVSKIAGAGEYELGYTVNLPTTVNTSNVIIENRTPKKITVTVEKLYAETFPIQFVFQGSIAEGYQAGDFTITPDKVVVSGPVEQIAQITSVNVLLERNELTERFAGDLPIRLIGVDGEVLTDLDVKLSTATAFVTLPVVVVKEIPLTVNFIEGGGATERDIAISTITPNKIIVSGAEEDIATLSEISLGSIDLSKVVGRDTLTFDINLDPSLTNVSGNTDATVSIELKDLATKSFDVTNIELAFLPDGYAAELATTMRTVVVRGDAATLEMIDSSQLRIVADLSHISALGSTSVPVKVYLDATSAAGVIGDYSIIVNISK